MWNFLVATAVFGDARGLRPWPGVPRAFGGSFHRYAGQASVDATPPVCRVSAGRALISPARTCRFRRFLAERHASDLRRDKKPRHRPSLYLVHFPIVRSFCLPRLVADCKTPFVASDMDGAFPRLVQPRPVAARLLLTQGSRSGHHRLIQDSYHSRWGDITVSGERLTIPYRHYDQAESSAIADDPVLAAWMTRCHDGRVREEALRALLAHRHEGWHPPFVIQLLGEYVIEICELIAEYMRDVLPRDPLAVLSYRSFWLANPSFVGLTRARVASYWAAYHWRSSTKLGYPGRAALDSLGTLVGEELPHDN